MNTDNTDLKDGQIGVYLCSPMERKSFALLIVALLLSTPINALACACCSEPGFYFSGPTDFSEHEFGEFERMRFSRTASLFLTPAGIDEDSHGIDQPKQNYVLTASVKERILKLSFRNGEHSGMLALVLPEKMWNHSADIHDRRIGPGGGPLLYKEWRFEGEVKGTGIFKAGTSSPSKYTLVLQGRGNGCDNAEDFSNWRVEVKGEKARYAFHGKLTRLGSNR